MTRALAAASAALMLVGCYRYQPTGLGTPQAGMQVAAELSDSGTVALARAVGPDAAAVEGRLVRVTETEIELAVTAVRQHSGTATEWRGERVVVARGLLSRLQERRLSRQRTALAAAAFAVGAAVVRDAFAGASGGSTPVVGSGPSLPR